ncbi:hypothetical protein RGF97_04160 [Streptomyces roseicoloratus]|uniref:Integral membrane protein n=1 Tax=Streptomyces roseicoloratus TaxID=2508722 RepID=A0ABY9RPU9_9ACTN|nr:hypothetical protein [Streptomyces roseicoloratus]WMX44211.1 hypothetical protein RGF97_04160 [Streptomyces roseicoloratus]
MTQALLTGLSRTTRPQSVLRRLLALDAVVTGANGLAYAVAPGPLGELLGIERGLLFELGLLLAVYAAGVGLLASRPVPSVPGVKAVIDINLLWTVGSVLAIAGWIDPTTAGTVWTLLQAGTVAGFAALQWAALRATRR